MGLAPYWPFFHKLIWDRCYDFKNIFAKKLGEKIAFLTQNKAKFCKILVVTLVFEKKRQYFRRKLQKIVIITSTPGHLAGKPKHFIVRFGNRWSARGLQIVSSVVAPTDATRDLHHRVARFFLVNITQTRKNVPNEHKMH
jgi:hypothetical protein